MPEPVYKKVGILISLVNPAHLLAGDLLTAYYSDLLSRHRKTHEKDSTVVEDSAEISHVLNQDEPITPESRPNNKRLRPTLNGESAATRPQAENSSTMIDDAPRENVGNHDAIPDNRASSGYGPGHSLHQDYQTGISDWDLRWPFYGEGLHDANLDWTLDFLSQGISTHSPFDAVPVYGDPGHTPRPQDLEVFLDANISGVEIDGPHEHEPQAWPDQQSRAVNPRHHRKSHESSRSTGRVKAEERAEFLRKYSAQMAQTTSQISEEMREAMLETIHASLLDEFCHEKGARKSSFPALSTIDYFLQLYFVHIQPRFPVLHVPTFDPNKTPVILLLAMAIVGSTYSESNQSKFALSYLERTRMSIKLTQEKDSNYVRLLSPKSFPNMADQGLMIQLRSVQHLLAFFLVSLSAMWLGHKMFYERAEGDRGELAIYCRRFELLDCRVKKKYLQSQSRQNRKRVEDSWMDWINEEQKKRLGLCIYVSLSEEC
jgi:hypothetical protein